MSQAKDGRQAGEALKPCPFCGGKAKLKTDCGILSVGYTLSPSCKAGLLDVSNFHSEALSYQITCTRCRSYVQTGLKETEADAVAAWNTRAVNSHEALVNALQAIENEGLLYTWVNEKDISKAEWDRRSALIEQLRSALAKAKEGAGMAAEEFGA